MNTINLSFLGSSYPLFFNYMKFCMIILMLLCLTSGQYNLISNYYGQDCLTKDEFYSKTINSSKTCLLDGISQLTIANKSTHVKFSKMQDLLNLSSIAVLILLLLFFRKE